ncbi:hypothetical protein MD484_g7950, partial [Candolleomyces efflorescens]
MNLGALQRVACGPDRWDRVIENHHANDAEDSPNLTQLEPVSVTKLPESCKAARACLVPGGRFLLIAEDKGSLQLWDAGPVGEAIRAPSTPIAEHQLANGDTGEVQHLTVCVMDERTLRVAVVTSNDADDSDDSDEESV